MSPVSSPLSATSTGSARLRLNPTNAQAAVFVRAAGARRFAFNWDLAQIKANQDQRAGEATYDSPRMDRTRPFSYFDLVRRWDAVKHAAVPWHVEQSVWTFRYGVRAAHVAHSRFLKRQSRFPRFKARHRGPAPVHDRRRSASSAGSPVGRQVRVGRPRRAVPGAGPAPAAAGARPGPDTEPHREQGRGWLLVRVGVLRTDRDRSTAGIQQAVGCRGRGGRRGQDRRGRGHSRRDPVATLEASRRPAGCPDPPQAPATCPVPDPERVGESRQGPAPPGPGTRPGGRGPRQQAPPVHRCTGQGSPNGRGGEHRHREPDAQPPPGPRPSATRAGASWPAGSPQARRARHVVR